MAWEDREMEWPQCVLDRSLELAHRIAEDPHIGFGTGLIAQPEGDHLILVGQGGQWLLSQDDLRPPFVSKGSLEVYSRDLLSAPLRTLEDVLRQCYNRFMWDPCRQTSPDPDCEEAPLKADQQKEADKYPDKHAYIILHLILSCISTYIYRHMTVTHLFQGMFHAWGPRRCWRDASGFTAMARNRCHLPQLITRVYNI